MLKKSRIILALTLAVLSCTEVSYAAEKVTTNLSVGSIYYDYIEKLEAMGYVKSMLPGTKPYSRLDMAKWTLEASETAKSKPLPKYLDAYLTELTRALEPELALVQGQSDVYKAKRGVKLREAKVEFAAGDFHQEGYSYGTKDLSAQWKAFNTNNQGYRYGDGLNFNTSANLSGMVGNEVAVSLTPRIGYDPDDTTKVSLEEGYIKTRIGAFGLEAGKEALVWGQGKSGNLAFGDNAKSQTMLRMVRGESERLPGIWSALGKMRSTTFISRLEGNRKEVSGSKGLQDFNHPYLFGTRMDFLYPGFTLGASRLVMFGGDGNAMHGKDYTNLLLGKAEDKWNDMAGIDARLRLPGVQLYGELYGEGQTHYLPDNNVAWIAGVYFPLLTRDGSWDLRIETARTTDAWYTNDTYQNGWTYDGNIMGDPMGRSASKYYLGAKRYLNAYEDIGFNILQVEMDSELQSQQKVTESWISYNRKIKDNMFLDAMLGIVKLKNANAIAGHDVTDKFMKVGVRFTF